MKKTAKLLIIMTVVMITVLMLLLVFKYPYYSKINGVSLPEHTATIKTEVHLSDIYGIHICAEKVVSTNLEYDELEQFIKENNSDYEKIGIFEIAYENGRYLVKWDDYCIDPDCIIPDAQSGTNYYLINYNTPYCRLTYEK